MVILFPNKITKNYNTIIKQAKISPTKAVLKPSYHWEGFRAYLYGNIIKKTDNYEMFYQCGNALKVCKATSKDGYNWEKPLFNFADFNIKNYNVLNIDENSNKKELTNIISCVHCPSIIYDKNYKLFSFAEKGFNVFFSNDGEKFKPLKSNPAIKLLSYKNKKTKKTWYSDVGFCFKENDSYFATIKHYIIDKKGRTRRAVSLYQSDNFKFWRFVDKIYEPNRFFDKIAKLRGFRWADFYGLTPFKYGDIWLGYLWLFEIQKELKHGTHQGKIEVFLVYSKNLLSWETISDKPFIPWDLNFKDDGGMLMATPPVFEKDHIKIYYSDCNFEHGFREKDFKKKIKNPIWNIRVYNLKKERITGIYSKNGLIEFPSYSFYKKRLRINADIKDKLIIIFKHMDKILYTKTITKVDNENIIIKNIPPFDLKIEIQLYDTTLYAVEIENE
jgi:hypothetical protein